MCPAVYDPVCANDEQYSNACSARCAGLQPGDWTAGPCDASVFMRSMPMQSRAPCMCTREYAPVCADGKQYSNSCQAECAGVETYTNGPCSKSYNCHTRERWPFEKSVWCCKNEGLGCYNICPMYDQPQCPDGSTPAITRSWTDENGCQKMEWEDCPPDCPQVMPPFCIGGQEPKETGSYTTEDGCVIPTFECPTPKCGKKEEFKQCGSACEPTCELLAAGPQMCTMQCVAGCFCKAGFIKNAAGKCIRENSKKCRKEACPKGELFTKCGTQCEPTCAKPTPHCNYMCKMNTCQCPQGRLKRSDGKCVSPKNRRCAKETKEAEEVEGKQK